MSAPPPPDPPPPPPPPESYRAGSGGSYGGGGGGGGAIYANHGAGAQGVIVITYDSLDGGAAAMAAFQTFCFN
jgi:hypothetical protein